MKIPSGICALVWGYRVLSELNGKPIGTFPGDTVADTATMSRGKAYAIAFALVAAAATVRYLLGLFDEGVLLFAIFFPGIMLTALWCGTGPAVFATILSLVVVWYAFIPPAFEFQLKARATWLNLGLFCGSSALIVWIGARHRKLLAAIEQSEKIRKLLVEELHHRSKNSMSVASTIISRTLSNQASSSLVSASSCCPTKFTPNQKPSSVCCTAFYSLS
jgi:K+-sensing histidine kinase KdpD